MTQNYLQFETRLSEPEPNLKAWACSIPIIEPTASLNDENELICCWKPKIWTLIICISQLIVCTIGLVAVFLFGQGKLSEWLMLHFKGDDNPDFFKWIVTFLVGLFSNGIFWGFLLYLGAKYKSICLLNIWLIAECLALIVTGVASYLAIRAYSSGAEIRFFPPSTVFPITCILFIGHLLGHGRIRLVFRFLRHCEFNKCLEQDAVASEL